MMPHLYDDILKYPEDKLIALMQLIRRNGNLMNLETFDGTFSQVVEAFDALQRLSYVELNEDRNLLFTEKGENLYRYLCKSRNLRGLYKYIMPNMTKRIPQKGFDELYIPKK